MILIVAVRDLVYHYVHHIEVALYYRWTGSRVEHILNKSEHNQPKRTLLGYVTRPGHYREDPLSRQLLLVSRQIHDEARPVMFRENTFGLLIQPSRYRVDFSHGKVAIVVSEVTLSRFADTFAR